MTIEIGGFCARTVRVGLMAGAAFLACAATQAAAQPEEDPSLPQAKVKLKNQYFGYAASVSPRVSYTNNIFLTPKDFAEDEFIASTLFTANAVVTSSRFTGLFSGDLDLSYLTDQGDFNVNQRIGAVGTATIADNLFYVDVAGSSSRQLIGDQARFTPNQNAARNQQTNVNSISVSPYFRREMAEKSVAEVRYRFSQAFVDQEGLARFLNDSQTQEALATLDTGNLLGRVRTRLTAYANRTDEDGSLIAPRFQYEQVTGMAELEFALSDHFSVTGAIGYDSVETDTPAPFFEDEDLSGVFWRAGFRAKPGRKTDLRFEYGERYGSDFIDADLSYKISERLRFSASAGRDFQTRAQAVNALLGNQQARVLDFVQGLREGQALSPAAVVGAFNRVPQGFEAQAIGLGVTDRANANLIGVFDRTTIGANVIYQDSDFGFRQIQTYGGGINIQRRMSRKLTGYGDVFHRFADTTIDLAECLGTPAVFGVDPTDLLNPPAVQCPLLVSTSGKSNTVGGRIGARYQIYQNLSAFGEFTRTQRFSKQPLLEYNENFVTAGLTLDF